MSKWVASGREEWVQCTIVDYRGKAWKVRKNRNIEEWRRRRIEGEDIQTNIGTKRSVFIVQEFVFNYTTACEIDVYIYWQVCIQALSK